MKIGIDASRYKFAQATGVEWYSYNIINHLLPRLGRDHNSTVTLFTNKDTIFDEKPPFNVTQKTLKMKKMWTLLRLSWEMLIHPVDVLFVPSHVPPLLWGKKLVVTIHDLAFRHREIKNIYTLKEKMLLEFSTRMSVWRADKIIVPSDATKDDLIRFYGCKKEKIIVVPHGAPELIGEKNPLLRKWTKNEQQQLLQKLGLKAEDLVVLFVGRLESKKNLIRLIEAFKRFSGEYPDWKLVLAGKAGIGYGEIQNKIQELKLEDTVIQPGYVTENEKEFLLNKCRIFVLPSLFEGFGLPILEAFAFGRPVITANTSSMPEVAGKAAWLVNPLNVAEISVGLKRLASDGVLVSKLVEEGKKQLEKFDWEQSAEKTLDAILY